VKTDQMGRRFRYRRPSSRRVMGFHDEALSGTWKGHRSSRLGIHYRVIYSVLRGELTVHVVDITKHDYRRKR
jgi:addiction module RelE/StbE family toxin